MSSLREDRLAGRRIVPGRSRTARLSRLRDALATIPPHLMADSTWDGVSARAAALGIVPGQAYGPRGVRREAMGDQPFVGEIIPVGFNFAPLGWERCDGQSLQIAEYDTLFVLLGTMYGGDGQNTFNVPGLQGRFPVHMGQGPGLSNRTQGETLGSESVTVTTPQMPAHTHGIGYATTAATDISPTGGVPAAVDVSQPARYGPVATGRLATSGVAGSSQPMDNMPPYLVLTFCISLFGIFPQQS